VEIKQQDDPAPDKIGQLIAKSMADLEEFINDDKKNMINEPDPTQKVQVESKNTYQLGTDGSFTKELFQDFEKLEMHYKLNLNWLEAIEEPEQPFNPNLSVIQCESTDKNINN
jgi:hypothetical protein